jgi:hypothetical protein
MRRLHPRHHFGSLHAGRPDDGARLDGASVRQGQRACRGRPRRRVQQHLDPAAPQPLQRDRCHLRAHMPQQLRSRLHQHDARLTGIQPRVVPRNHPREQRRGGGRRFHARRAAADHDHRQHRAPLRRIALARRALQHVHHAVPYGDRVLELLQRERVRARRVVAEVVRRGAQRDDQVVVQKLARIEPHPARTEVHARDLVPEELRAPAGGEPAQRVDDVPEGDAARRGLVKHGSEEMVVAAIDQRDARAARQPRRQLAHGGHAREAPAQHPHARRAGRHPQREPPPHAPLPHPRGRVNARSGRDSHQESMRESHAAPQPRFRYRFSHVAAARAATFPADRS